MIRYAHRHGMIREPMAPAALFFPPSLETMPVGYAQAFVRQCSGRMASTSVIPHCAAIHRSA